MHPHPPFFFGFTSILFSGNRRQMSSVWVSIYRFHRINTPVPTGNGRQSLLCVSTLMLIFLLRWVRTVQGIMRPIFSEVFHWIHTIFYWKSSCEWTKNVYKLIHKYKIIFKEIIQICQNRMMWLITPSYLHSSFFTPWWCAWSCHLWHGLIYFWSLSQSASY